MRNTIVSSVALVYVGAADGTSVSRSLSAHVRGVYFWSGRGFSSRAPSEKPLNKSVAPVNIMKRIQKKNRYAHFIA